jgi:hypothetical protein
MMSERKQTPDILAAILNGEAPATADFDAQALARATPPPRVKTQPKRAAPVKTTKEEKTAPAAKPRPVAPVHWTYQVLSFQENHGWRVRFIDGKEVRNWSEAPTLGEMLVQMGEHGWELVSACSGETLFGRADKYQLFFKRAPKGD